MTTSPRTLGVQTIRHHRTLTFPRHQTGGNACPRAGDSILFYPRWYRSDQQGALHLIGTSRVPRGKVVQTPLRDWRLELETLLDAPLDQSLQAFQGTVCYTVFYDLSLTANWQDGEPMWFPPCAYVHLEPCLYRTDAQSRLHVLGRFSAKERLSPEGFVHQFSQLTGIDPYTTPIVNLSRARP